MNHLPAYLWALTYAEVTGIAAETASQSELPCRPSVPQDLASTIERRGSDERLAPDVGGLANTSVWGRRHPVLVHAEVEGSQVRRRVLHGMRDDDRAVAFGVGEARGAMGAHAPGEPQRLRHDVRLRGGGVGRQQGLAGSLRCRDLRTADPELTRSELGLIEPSAALRVGPERHAVGAHAAGEGERLVVCRAAAR